MSVPVPVSSDATRAVITKSPLSAGQSVRSGDELVGVCGHPIFGLDLSIPMYRDLAPGDNGPDVASVQRALQEAGLYRGAIDGRYGARTISAVQRLYTRAGYAAPAVPDAGSNAPDAGTGTDPSSGAGPNTGAGTLDATTPSGSAGAASNTIAPSSETTGAVSGNEPTGTALPTSDVVDIPAKGVTVLSTHAVGAVVASDGALLTLRTGTANVVARVPVADQDRYTVGTSVYVTLPGVTQDPIAAKVDAVSGFRPSDDTGALPGYDATVSLSGATLKGATDHMAASVTPAGADKATTGIAVPLTVLREDAEGTYVLRADAAHTRVDVKVGLQGDGYAEIAGDLKPGAPLLLGDVKAGS